MVSSTIPASQEYLMPERRKRAAIYVRESDVSLAMDSTTIESAVKALLDHCRKEGYSVDPSHIFREAISGYSTYYFDRPELMKMLACVSRKEFDVLCVTEIRALSRRGAGEVLLSFRASWARIEREQSFIRMQRGKKDRIEIGNAPPNGRACYGYKLVDTEKETKARYVFNMDIIHVDQHNTCWSEINVRKYILEQLLEGVSLNRVAIELNELGLPPPSQPRKGTAHWDATTVRRIAESPINIGKVYVNQYKRVKTKNDKHTMKKLPEEEWILLEGIAPALIDEDAFAMILRRIAFNKQGSLRNNKHTKELGLVRSGHIFCGVCSRKMQVAYPSVQQPTGRPHYLCKDQSGKSHRTQIHITLVDNAVKEKIREALLHPEAIRSMVEEIRRENKPVVNKEEIQETITKLQQKLRNLYALAKELIRFEKWAYSVQEAMTDPSYIAHASYQELRFAVEILGIRVTVFPTQGDYPYRYKIDIKIPELLAKVVGRSSH
jgi:hypothetical protein